MADNTDNREDIMSELFGDYVNKDDNTEGENYVNYDTDVIPVDEIAKAEAELNSESFEADANSADDDLGYTGYAPRNVVEDDDVTTYVDLDSFSDDAKPSKRRNKAFKNKKLLIGVLGAAATLLIIVGVVFVWLLNVDPLKDYTQLTVGRGSVLNSVTVKGNLEPYSKYEIFPLVSGKITEAPFELGDKVDEGELLYKVDDTEAALSLKRAKNDVERAKAVTVDSGNSGADDLRIYAPATGVISNLTLRTGSTVTGMEVGNITRDDGTVVPIIPGVRGIVRSVSVYDGQSVVAGQLLATLKNTASQSTQQTTSASRALGILDAEIGVDVAESMLSNYSIASPVDGTVLSINAKVGDNVTPGCDTPLMVVADMSRMKLVIKVDELDVGNMEEGQEVIVTAKTLPDETFYGEVTYVAGEGNIDENGVTTFDVEITVDDTEDLKAGMNVTAKIILESASNALTIPEDALHNPDGKHAYVLVKNTDDETVDVDKSMDFNDMDLEKDKENKNNGKDRDLSKENSEEGENFPAEEPPKGCSWVRVKYGISDGTNVQIISGLREGDIVVYKRIDPLPEYNDAEPEESAEPDEDFERDFNKNMTGEDNTGKNSDNKKEKKSNSPAWIDTKKEDKTLEKVA